MKKKRPRNSAKAVIIHRGKLLVIRKESEGKSWFLLPGGGQHEGETLHEALVREVFEETGALCVPGDLLFLREYRSDRHEFADFAPRLHQVEFYFRARLKPGQEVGLGPEHDDNQTGVEWIPLSQVTRKPIYPLSLRRLMKGLSVPPIYRGDVN